MPLVRQELRPPCADLVRAFGPARFFNRELSWLEFNRRVLEEAANLKNPLLERVRFLAISGSNLDEFYRVRVAGLHEQAAAHIETLSQEGLTPARQLEKIGEAVARLFAEQQRLWLSLRAALAREGIRVLEANEVSEAERDWLKDYFERSVFTALNPIAVDAAHPFPFVQSQELVIVLACRRIGAGEPAFMHTLLPIPAKMERFVRLPASTDGNGKPLIRFIAIETLIGLFAGLLAPGYTAEKAGVFRLLRNSEIDLNEKGEDLQRTMRQALNRRKLGNVIRLEMSASIPEAMRDLIVRKLKVSEQDICLSGGLIAPADFAELVVKDRPKLLFKPFRIRFPERIREFGNDCLAAISAKDILVHHPYESFDVVVQYLRQAAADPEIVAIKWTLYRTSKQDSPIVRALREARQAGKLVTVMIEVTARFDEENNLRWAQELEKVGVQVVYGLTNLELKTHAKLGQVVRRENGELKTYCHIGTGNNHPVTARSYTDLSYFTADPAIGRDLSKIFNYVTTYAKPEDLEAMSISPDGIKAKILQHIREEIAHAEAGRPAAIWMKLNALGDPDVIDALYEASLAGVPVDLIVRGICCLRPGVPGLSDNIRAKSIVGRFLEHSRIYCFGGGHGLPSDEAHVYISSADMMPRNLERRVEAMAPIANPTVHEQILEQIMIANLKDNQQSWTLLADGTSRRVEPGPGEEPFSAHDYFMTNPSLSGRGGALKKTFPRRFTMRPAAQA
jgi:polyphosphate kinase